MGRYVSSMLIQDLPVEVIAQVFVCFVEAQQPFQVAYDCAFSKVYCSAPLVLSAVCRVWRNITVGTPQLWTSPAINFHSTNKLPVQQDILKLWLERSRSLPLRISLVNFDNSDFNFEFFRPIFDQLKEHSERWEMLLLIMSRRAYPIFLQGLTHTPSLRVIYLKARLTDPLRQPKFLLPNASKVQELRLAQLSVSDLGIVWDNLTIFETAFGGSHELLEALRRARRLKKCSVRGLEFDHDSEYSIPALPSRHTYLEELELRSMQTQPLEFVMNRLELPSLRRLIHADQSSMVRSRPFRDLQLTHIHGLLTRSQCRLRELEIRGLYASSGDEELMEILECQPSLEYLSLGSVRIFLSGGQWLSDNFFTDHANFVTLSRLLPHLKTLRISGMRAFSWDAFLAFLNLTHLHLSGSGKSRIIIRHSLDIPSERTTEDYITQHVVSQLVERGWEQSVCLTIWDSKEEEDIIEASLVYHGFKAVATR